MSLSNNLESVIAEIESITATMADFKPAAWFEPDMDQLVFMRSDAQCVATRVDMGLTVFQDENGEVAGFKIKGVRWIYMLLSEQGRVNKDGFFKLVDALDALWFAAVAKAPQEPTLIVFVSDSYKRAHAISKGIKVPPPDNILKVA